MKKVIHIFGGKAGEQPSISSIGKAFFHGYDLNLAARNGMTITTCLQLNQAEDFELTVTRSGFVTTETTPQRKVLPERIRPPNIAVAWL